MAKERFLKSVYGLDSQTAVRDYYDAWAASYDAELSENGYATPVRAAVALVRLNTSRNAQILDMGCGTGLSGAALAAQGFTTIDGCDLSPGMLERAHTRRIYRRLFLVSALPKGLYDVVAAVGVIGPGAAPVSVFDTCVSRLSPGGRFVFSFNDLALQAPEFSARLETAQSIDGLRLAFQERGDHLPGIEVKSTIYVLDKT